MLAVSEMKDEAGISIKRRDWAFSERDKIVQERESIRKQCDELRRERDRAVSDYVEVLRELDELNKSKSNTCKELKEIRWESNSWTCWLCADCER